jgi:hypothetical protein
MILSSCKQIVKEYQNSEFYGKLFISPFLFASCTNASTFSNWCDGRRGRERGPSAPSVIGGAKPGVEVGNRNTYKLTN